VWVVVHLVVSAMGVCGGLVARPLVPVCADLDKGSSLAPAPRPGISTVRMAYGVAGWAGSIVAKHTWVPFAT